MTSSKTPPRFVPTLTEVVQVPDPLAHEEAVEVSRPPSAWGGASVQSSTTAQPMPAAALAAPVLLSEGVEELLIHRVMQRVGVVLDHRLRDAIATVVQEQTRSVLPRLREEIESVVRQAVYEAVTDELAAGPSAADIQR